MKALLLSLLLLSSPAFGAAKKIVNADIGAAASIAHSKMAALTASRAMVTNGSGFASASVATATELSYLSGVSSALQTQLDAKQALDGDLTAIAALTGTNTIYFRSAANTWTAVTIGSGLDFTGGTLSTTGGGGAGDVVGPASSTDNAIARFDSTTGKQLQNSGVTVSDGNVVTATGFVGPLTGAVTGNADTASALATNPTACGAGDFVTDIAADGTLTCATPAGGGGGNSLVGALRITNSVGWSLSANSSYQAFAAAGTVSSSTLTSGSGSCSLSASNTPSITCTSLPAGTYKITGISDFSSTAGGQSASFTFYDGTNYGQSNAFYTINAGAAFSSIGTVISYFTYGSTQTSITFNMAGKLGGSGTIYVGTNFPEFAVIVERIY